MPRETAAQKARRLAQQSEAVLEEGATIEHQDDGPDEFQASVSQPKGAPLGSDVMNRTAAKANDSGAKLLNSIPQSGTVTVACKLPNGLFLRVFDKTTKTELVLGGGMREYPIWEPREGGVNLNGYAVPDGKRARYPIIGDFALTQNVSAEFFRMWVEQNITTDVVRRGLVFCHKSPHQAQDIAKERDGDLKSGFEPIDPAGDKRLKPERRNKNLVDTGTEEGLRKSIGLGGYGN